jgi:hypothetical protein
MENSTTNPLTGFFRQPAIYIKLPSNGKYWDSGSLELTATGEIPVYPMTTKDELMLKTPDALLNGQGVVEVVQSCCPNIKDAWRMPSVDLDTVLIAIRIATYGSTMPISSKCIHCGTEHEHDVNMSSILSMLTVPEYSESLSYKTLKIRLKPQQYFMVNKASKVSFEEQRLMSALQMGEDIDPAVKSAQLSDSMQKLIELSLENAADSTDYIEMEDGVKITNSEHIREFYSKAELGVTQLVQAKLAALAEDSKLKPLQVHCDNCDKDYNLEITFDYSSFFAQGF